MQFFYLKLGLDEDYSVRAYSLQHKKTTKNNLYNKREHPTFCVQIAVVYKLHSNRRERRHDARPPCVFRVNGEFFHTSRDIRTAGSDVEVRNLTSSHSVTGADSVTGA